MAVMSLLRVFVKTLVCVAATPIALPHSSLCENGLQNDSQQTYSFSLAIFTNYVNL